MKKLRVGLIGLGNMGKNHLRVLSSLDDVVLVGVADPLGYEISSNDLGHGIFENYRELLAQKLDYCVIAAPTGFHKEIAIDALKNGVNRH